jgi:hypothetical protein
MTDTKAETKRQCSYCGSKEGKPRPVGNYIVELKEINYKNEIELACQSCYMIRKKIVNDRSKASSLKTRLIKKLKKLVFPGFLFTVTSVVIFTELGLSS